MAANKNLMIRSRISLVEAGSLKDPVGAAVQLMRESWLHRRWTIADFERLILPPIELNQCVFARLGFDVIGFVSWALFSNEASQAFAEKVRPLQARDWQSGANLWIIDFMSSPGEGGYIANAVLAHLSVLYPDQKIAQAIRYKRSGIQRRIVSWTMAAR